MYVQFSYWAVDLAHILIPMCVMDLSMQSALEGGAVSSGLSNHDEQSS